MQFLVQWGEVARYSLYAVFGGSAALVELVSIVELILAGGIGEVWHGVWGDGDVCRGGDAAAGAWRATPWQKKQTLCVMSVLSQRSFSFYGSN